MGSVKKRPVRKILTKEEKEAEAAARKKLREVEAKLGGPTELSEQVTFVLGQFAEKIGQNSELIHQVRSQTYLQGELHRCLVAVYERQGAMGKLLEMLTMRLAPPVERVGPKSEAVASGAVASISEGHPETKDGEPAAETVVLSTSKFYPDTMDDDQPYSIAGSSPDGPSS